MSIKAKAIAGAVAAASLIGSGTVVATTLSGHSSADAHSASASHTEVPDLGRAAEADLLNEAKTDGNASGDDSRAESHGKGSQQNGPSSPSHGQGSDTAASPTDQARGEGESNHDCPEAALMHARGRQHANGHALENGQGKKCGLHGPGPSTTSSRGNSGNRPTGKPSTTTHGNPNSGGVSGGGRPSFAGPPPGKPGH